MNKNEKNKPPQVGDYFPTLPAKPREEMEGLFRNIGGGFNGADGDSSYLLKDGRSLWLFGDTLFGDRKNWENIHMPRSTIGIMENPHDHKTPLNIYWRGGDKPKKRAMDFLPSARPGEWLWPGTACEVEGKLYFFLHRFQTDKSAFNQSSFQFRYCGLYPLAVDNPQANPADWELRKVNLPPMARSVFWATACRIESDGYLYMWGATRGKRAEGTVAARLPYDNIEGKKDQGWEYYSERNGIGDWHQETTKLSAMFPDNPSELSLSYLEKQKVYVTVYGFHKDNSIGLRVAENIGGPWSEFENIYTPPEPKWNKAYFCYAPKAHPEMSKSGNELIITYITNAYDVMDVFKDERIYFPRFISAPMK